jgi:hypothetical protein
MKGILRRLRPSPAMVVACTALVFAMTGAGYAAGMLGPNTVGTKQLKKNAVISSKVKNGSLLRADFKSGQIPAGPRGPQGPQGPQGIQGAQGAQGIQGIQGPQGILAEAVVAAPVGTTPGGATAFVFVGETQSLTLGAGQSIVGVATGQLVLSTGAGPQAFGFTLCYRQGAGPVKQFLSNVNDFQVATAIDRLESHTAAAAVSLPAGTYSVGFCAYNPGPTSLSGDWAIGMFQVYNGTVAYNPASSPSAPEKMK